jgi:hypothetical protein
MSFTLMRRFLWMSLAAAISTHLYAVDGVILIDPGKVNRGGITPGDGPGFPITISQPGSYRLTGNLTVPDAFTTAIEITADNVTLDLNGFSILGPNVCTPNPTTCTHSGNGVGVHAGSFSAGVVAPRSVKVMNGMVRGMGFHGVRLMGDATAVERVHATSNGGPGIVVGTGSVTDSIATVNGTGSAIIGWIVRGCMSANNGNVGISIRQGGAAIGNTSAFNGGDGISAYQATVKGNTTNNNGDNGIDVTCPGSVTGNTAVGNPGGNIRTTGICTLADNAQ